MILSGKVGLAARLPQEVVSLVSIINTMRSRGDDYTQHPTHIRKQRPKVVWLATREPLRFPVGEIRKHSFRFRGEDLGGFWSG
jgi:hypothetical protein